MTQATETAKDRLRRELHRALDSVRHELDRIDILTGALHAFSTPVPDYEPEFHHLNRQALNAHLLR
jgi:hypothetical protein